MNLIVHTSGPSVVGHYFRVFDQYIHDTVKVCQQLFEQVSLVLLVSISRKTHSQASFLFRTVHLVRSRRTGITNPSVKGTLPGADLGAADLGICALVFVNPASRAGGAAFQFPCHLMDHASCEN
jgi:hypothetical protein